jgi:hypothetical protein
MNPKHPDLLKAALEKFKMLTYRQIAEIFRGEIHGRSVERCISLVSKSGHAQRHQFRWEKTGVYTSFPTAFLILQKALSENPEQFAYEYNHRVASTDVLIALARRSFVSNIVTESEIKQLKTGSPVIGRRPDGLFTLKRGKDLPVLAALEVESSLRNRKRIQNIIESYVETFSKYPDRLGGVLIIALTANIAHAYRDLISQISENHRSRFVLSERKDIIDVKETILGRAFVPLSNNPNCQLVKWAGCRPSTPVKMEHESCPPDLGHP